MKSIATTVLLATAFASASKSTCPEGWNPERCLGSSGKVAGGPAVPYTKSKPVTWEAGMAGHSHYDIGKAALLVIDPQLVYAACPTTQDVENLVKPPTAEGFEGHSPLCCEGFYPAVANQNKLAAASRAADIPVFVVAHVYRDVDGDGAVDNCNRMCDFDVLGWSGWPEAWNLWNEAYPWHAPLFAHQGKEGGFEADLATDYYVEKSVFSAMTEPVVKKLLELGVDTVIVTGFMTQYCSVTTSRHAHDLGFKVMFVDDANDGPILQQLLSGVDENQIIPFYLSVPVADVLSTEDVLAAIAEGQASAHAEL